MSEGKQDEMTQQDDDSSDDGLWNEFESCAASVTHLYRNSNWRTLQSAAASTTQLYKHGLETKKRSYDRGFTKGRLKLAREISAMCRYKNKIDVGDLVALFSKYDLLPTAADAHHHHHHHGGQSPRHHQRTGETGNGGGGAGINVHSADGVANPNAVFLFQEALAPVSNPSASPHRNGNGGLGSFLQNQVCRHRKRPHSPGIGSTPCGPPTFDIVSKRFKRL